MTAHPLIALQNYVKSHYLTLTTLPLSPGMNVVGSPCRRYNFWVSEGHECLSLCVERVHVLELATVSPLMVKNQGFNVQYHDDHNRLHQLDQVGSCQKSSSVAIIYIRAMAIVYNTISKAVCSRGLWVKHPSGFVEYMQYCGCACNMVAVHVV